MEAYGTLASRHENELASPEPHAHAYLKANGSPAVDRPLGEMLDLSFVNLWGGRMRNPKFATRRLD